MAFINQIQKDFTMIPNGIFNDCEADEIGVISYIASRPTGWIFSAAEIGRKVRRSTKTVEKILKEIEKKGYLVRKKRNNGIVDYYLRYPPFTDFQSVKFTGCVSSEFQSVKFADSKICRQTFLPTNNILNSLKTDRHESAAVCVSVKNGFKVSSTSEKDINITPEYAEALSSIDGGFRGATSFAMKVKEAGIDLRELRSMVKSINASSATNKGGTLRSSLKEYFQIKKTLSNKIEAKKIKDEADQKLAQEQATRAKTRIQEAEKRDLENDAKYSKFLPEFYAYCLKNSFDDFLKNNFIEDFKRKYKFQKTTKFSELRVVVQGCFMEWHKQTFDKTKP